MVLSVGKDGQKDYPQSRRALGWNQEEKTSSRALGKISQRIALILLLLLCP